MIPVTQAEIKIMIVDGEYELYLTRRLDKMSSTSTSVTITQSMAKIISEIFELKIHEEDNETIIDE